MSTSFSVIAAVALRLGGLVLRFAMSLFIARFLPLADLGGYGLLLGVTATLPGAAGLGLSYFVNREIIGSTGKDIAYRVRDRLLVTFFSALCAVLIGIMLLAAGLIITQLHIAVVCVIVLIEMIGFDLHLSMLSRQRPTAANVTMFVRSAAWIPFYITAALALPSLRSLNCVLYAWLIGDLFYVAIVIILFRRHLRDMELWKRKIDTAWLRRILPGALLIWASDASLALSSSVDRFFISLATDLTLTGVFFFFFSIGNAAVAVCQASTVQIYMPIMRLIYAKHRDVHELMSLSRTYLIRMLLITISFMLLSWTAAAILVRLLQRDLLAEYLPIMPLILIGLLGRSTAEYLGIIDYILEKDRRYAAFNMGGLLGFIVLNIALTFAFGVVGAAIALALGGIGLVAVRGAVWYMMYRRAQRQRPAAIISLINERHSMYADAASSKDRRELND